MKRQVDGTEELGELLRTRLFPSHGNSFPAS
jgi:hypothetical protein